MRLRIVFIFLFLCSCSFASLSSIELREVKNMIRSEEFLASAVIKYLRENGSVPSNYEDVKTYLDKGFVYSNIFTENIIIGYEDEELYFETLNSGKTLNNFSYSLYFSNKNRVDTSAPISKKYKKVNIKINYFDKQILRNLSKITIDEEELSEEKTILLDNKVLKFYDDEKNHLYSITSDKLILSTYEIIGEAKQEVIDKLYIGQKVFFNDTNSSKEYIYLGELGGLKAIRPIAEAEGSIGKTILQFSRRAGGMLVNGDLYVWGNNSNPSISIPSNVALNHLGNKVGSDSSNRISYNTAIRVKAKLYEDNLPENINVDNIYSSAFRPKFRDFSSDLFHGSCATTTKGELYCNGENLNYKYDSTPNDNDNTKDKFYFKAYETNKDKSLMDRHSYFTNENRSIYVDKVFGLRSAWLVLADNETLNNGLPSGGRLYVWGRNKQGYFGETVNSNTKIQTPTFKNIFNNETLRDLTYTLSPGYRRIGALSDNDEIYVWGLDYKITGTSSINANGKWTSRDGSCSQDLGKEEETNTCEPILVEKEEGVKFKSFVGGLQSFIAQDYNGEFYRIRNQRGVYPKAQSITSLISQYVDYSDSDEIISVDQSSKLISGNENNLSVLEYGTGIVWVTQNHELKGDYFTPENIDDEFFKEAIKRIEWKKIKVIEDNNGMCGIDINNQMYCWGVMTFLPSSTQQNVSTHMVPVFNTNLYDLNKDYLFSIAGVDGSPSNVITNLTSGDWIKDLEAYKDGSDYQGFFMKYPTYIGGFNYEFEFK